MKRAWVLVVRWQRWGRPSTTSQPLCCVGLGTTPHGTQSIRILHFLSFINTVLLQGSVFQAQTKDILIAMTWGIPLSSLLCPTNCLALYLGLGGEGPWLINNKCLLGVMHTATLKGKTQQGLVNLIWKISFLSSTHTKAGCEQCLQPSCGKVWLKHGLASCFTPTKKQGSGRVSWENWIPRTYLPASTFGPSALPRNTLPPTKQWANFGIWELKPHVKQENKRRWLEQLWLVLGSNGLSQEGTCPTAQEGRQEKGLCHLPTRPWNACTVQPPAGHHMPGARKWLLLGSYGILPCWNSRSFVYVGLEKVDAGLEAFGNHCVTLFNLVHLYCHISPFPKTS